MNLIVKPQKRVKRKLYGLRLPEEDMVRYREYCNKAGIDPKKTLRRAVEQFIKQFVEQD